MNKRSKLLALLGAGLLTFGVASVALANDLGTDKPHMVAPTTIDELVSDQGVLASCEGFTGDNAVGDGQIGIHFVQNPEATSGNISGHVDGTAFGPIANTVKGQGNGQLQWFVVVDGSGDSVINDATTDVTGGVLTVSSVCVGAPESSSPSESTSETPSNSGGGLGDTNQPPTDAIPAGTGTSGPNDTAWLLVVGLGVLLASIVVLTPARAKSKR